MVVWCDGFRALFLSVMIMLGIVTAGSSWSDCTTCLALAAMFTPVTPASASLSPNIVTEATTNKSSCSIKSTRMASAAFSQKVVVDISNKASPLSSAVMVALLNRQFPEPPARKAAARNTINDAPSNYSPSGPAPAVLQLQYVRAFLSRPKFLEPFMIGIVVCYCIYDN